MCRVERCFALETATVRGAITSFRQGLSEARRQMNNSDGLSKEGVVGGVTTERMIGVTSVRKQE